MSVGMGLGGIPRAPLALGLAGLLPFLAGAANSLGLTAGLSFPEPPHPFSILGEGPALLIAYATVILSFMSGILWGFATRSTRPAFYVLSVVPALWAFFTLGDPQDQLLRFMVGFLMLSLVEQLYIKAGLTPDWWQPLRATLTIVVLICLYCGTFAATAA